MICKWWKKIIKKVMTKVTSDFCHYFEVMTKITSDFSHYFYLWKFFKSNHFYLVVLALLYYFKLFFSSWQWASPKSLLQSKHHFWVLLPCFCKCHKKWPKKLNAWNTYLAWSGAFLTFWSECQKFLLNSTKNLWHSELKVRN